MGLGSLETTPQGGPYESVVPTLRARPTIGLRTRPLGTITYEVTGGDNAADTFDMLAGGVSLVAAPVAWTSSHGTTAAAIATAINANFAAHNYLATVSSATVTIMQRRSGAAPTFSVTEVGDAAGTLGGSGNMTGDTDTWTEFVSGATFDGALYYELGFSGALLAVENLPATPLRAVNIDFYCDGQAVTFWVGSFRAAGNAIVQGLPLATATWLHTTYGSVWPFLKTADVDLNTDIPFIIKVAADEELLYSVGVI